MRHVYKTARCSFCGFDIPRGLPGTTTGSRGTKAYFNAQLGEWECIGCRQEALRAQAAREGR